MNIIFFGDLNQYGRAIHRRNALLELGHYVTSISYIKVSNSNNISSYGLINRILWRLKLPISDNGSNKLCIKHLHEKKYDVIWVDNGLLFFPWTLYRIKKISPETKIILFSEDDLCVWHGMTLWLRINFSKFTAIFTTKSHNVQELQNYGQLNVHKVYDSYIPSIHDHIDSITSESLSKYSADVSAIGAYEPERARSLEFLAKNNIKVNVWGLGWEKFKTKYPNYFTNMNQFLVGKEYALAINCSKINLNFLRKVNRDTITSRTIEIPACRGFMISERTGEQTKILTEGQDAEYFSDDIELLSKITKYLINNEEREKIALSGYKKVRSLKLDVKSIVENTLKTVS